MDTHFWTYSSDGFLFENSINNSLLITSILERKPRCNGLIILLAMICIYCRMLEIHTSDALASYAVAVLSFLPPFAKASKIKYFQLA
jgi:hypothetical protein